MLCQDCNKREACVKFTQIVNNEKTTLALCNECAASRGFHPPLENAPFPLAEILSGLASSEPTERQPELADDLRCPGVWPVVRGVRPPGSICLRRVLSGVPPPA